MKNKILFYLLFAGSLLFACNYENPKKKNEPLIRSTIDTTVHSVDYVFDVAADTTLIVADSKIMMTINAGKNWHAIKHFPVINQITVDKKNVIWAIYYWAGLHEPGGSILFKSSDWGKSWQEFEFDLKQFAPEQIISNVHEPLTVISKNKTYVLKGENPQHDFHECKECPAPRNDEDIAFGYGAVDSNNRTLILKNNHGKPTQIAALDSVGTLQQLLKLDDTLFAVGNGIIKGDYAIPYLCTIVGKKVRRYNVPAHYVKIYKGFDKRIWAVAGGNLYIKNDTGLKRVPVR